MSNSKDRLVALQGASNFRDLGGYLGHAARPVRWGRLYRSDHLAQLTPADVAEIRARQVQAAIDFRGVQESAAATYQLEGVTLVKLSIEPTVVQRMQGVVSAGQLLDEATAVGLMEDLYRNIVRQQMARLRSFFDQLLAAERPLVFHCTAGKDRTGVAAALLLSALGVSRADVMQDFLLTNEFYRPAHTAKQHGTEGAARALWGVRPQYLAAAWELIDDELGGAQAYLRDSLALSEAKLAALRARFLEPA
jgi:protein-tyrosine phosphatase